VTEHVVDDQLEWLHCAREVMKLEIAGVDLVRGRTGYQVIEVNSAPGFEASRSDRKKRRGEMLRYALFAWAPSRASGYGVPRSVGRAHGDTERRSDRRAVTAPALATSASGT